MPERLDGRRTVAGEVTARAARVLADGGLVLLPTEAGPEVFASALHPPAVARLQALAPTGETPAVVLSAAAEALDWLPSLRGPGLRLVRKVGPGPWLLQSRGTTFGLLERLPAEVRTVLAPDGFLTLRWPQFPLGDGLARQVRQPLVGRSVDRQAESAVDLVIDDDQSIAGPPLTLVRCDGRGWEMTRPGALAREVLDEVMACRILFVCTGNTCRSPMAEALCTALLAEKLGCPPEELPRHGFRVQSAGLAAARGDHASPDAAAVVHSLGGTLEAHRSQPLSYELFTLADHVLVMTASHLQALQAVNAAGGPVPQQLAPAGDISDPIGRELAVYAACAEQIREALRRRLPEFLES